MRIATVMLAIVCCISAVSGQWTVTTIQMPDSLFKLDSICSVQFHSPNNTVYVGGGRALVAVDAGTHKGLARTAFPGSLNMMCSSTAGNKLYCAASNQESVWVMDCATNQILTTVPLDGQAHAMCYAAASNKVYVACPPNNLVDVIDCETDSVVAEIELQSWPSALCYNPELNRIYSAQSLSDEVAVIDCAADTLISTIWVRGVKPGAICYDSATSCVYTSNYTSGTASVIDCASDSVVRVVTVGARLELMMAGPEGKVYCGSYFDSVVTVVELQGTRSIPVGRHLSSMSLDPVNNKVYCATSDSVIVVVDAIGDTVAARVGAGEDLRFVCYDPVDTSTWAASAGGATIGVIDGAMDRLIDFLLFSAFSPGALCYNPVNSRLYCMDHGQNHAPNLLVVIDGDSNRVLKTLRVENSTDSMVWNPVSNKIYFSSPADNTVSILDCTTDSITATVETGDGPDAMCCSDDGKVYVTTKGRQSREVTRGNDKGRSFDVSTFYFTPGVAVIDPDGDSLLAFVPTVDTPTTLCYDRTDNKVYAGLGNAGLVSVIDVDGDSVMAAVPVAQSGRQVSWNQRHNKVYVCAPGELDRCVVVIDCTSDTVLGRVVTGGWPWTAYSDSACDKVYVVPSNPGLYIVNAATDTLYRTLSVGIAGGTIDNRRPGAANLLYCIGNGGLYVIDGVTDDIQRFLPVGDAPTALAWNPVHSWVYVSNSGSSSITVVSDTMLGIEESQPQAASLKPQATVVRGVLFLPRDMTEIRPWISDRVPRPVLLDVSGRKAMELKPGANDVRALAPGVYFVRSEPSATSRQSSAVTKVIIAE
jgi:YVTN family beta-propeller protein